MSIKDYHTRTNIDNTKRTKFNRNYIIIHAADFQHVCFEVSCLLLLNLDKERLRFAKLNHDSVIQ